MVLKSIKRYVIPRVTTKVAVSVIPPFRGDRQKHPTYEFYATLKNPERPEVTGFQGFLIIINNLSNFGGVRPR